VSNTRILVVDDDPDIRELLSAYLGEAGFVADTAASGAQMWECLGQYPYDLIVLDLMMPGEDGLALCGQLRHRTASAVIMLTARAEPVDRVVGLELGADDYVTKPFDPRELLARIRAVLRRAAPGGSPAATEAADAKEIEPLAYRFLGWQLDMRARHLVSPEGLVISLPASDFRVLAALASQPNQPVSRDVLVQRAFGRPQGAMDRAIDVCISRLRQHLEPMPRQPTLIRTVRHEGYMLYCDQIERLE